MILLLQVTVAAAQVPASATNSVITWDVNVSASLFEARPGGTAAPSHDDWYAEGRYAASIGRYWTPNLKTEVEFATTGEGSRYVTNLVQVPGTGVVYPIGGESFHRMQHGSIRMVWQFLDNAWVHPYLNGGFVLERERARKHVQEFRAPPDPRGVTPPIPPTVIVPSGEMTGYRGGATVGGGAKFYVSPNAYINTGMQATYAKPATTVSFVAGFGVDF